MNGVERSACVHNIVQLRSKLENETDATKRTMMVRLVINEIAKLGFTLEQIADIDRYIARCRELLAEQQSLKAQMQRSGRDTSSAQALLETLAESLEAHQQHRNKLIARLHDITV